MKKKHLFLAGAAVCAMACLLGGCTSRLKTSKDYAGTPASSSSDAAEGTSEETEHAGAASAAETDAAVSSAAEMTETTPAAEVTQTPDEVTSEEIAFDPSWEYAANSKINSGTAMLYHAKPSLANGHVICINAGHGTKGGTEVTTLCHPDGTPKVTGGTTEEGATEAVAVSTGTEFLDGTPEAEITLKLALVVKDKLLSAGYDVLMIRESGDVQLDNIARTVIANQNADCHIALHYDSTDFDKGVFYMSVPSDERYRSMEPVASHYQEHNALGDAVVGGIESVGMKLFEGGAMEMDLTQTSYSTVPSIDLEVGDAASDYSEKSLNTIADGILAGLNDYYKIA